jgi:hypothetical protein
MDVLKKNLQCRLIEIEAQLQNTSGIDEKELIRLEGEKIGLVFSMDKLDEINGNNDQIVNQLVTEKDQLESSLLNEIRSKIQFGYFSDIAFRQNLDLRSLMKGWIRGAGAYYLKSACSHFFKLNAEKHGVSTELSLEFLCEFESLIGIAKSEFCY